MFSRIIIKHVLYQLEGFLVCLFQLFLKVVAEVVVVIICSFLLLRKLEVG